MLFWILGGLIAATGLAGTMWSLFADRSRGRKRCPRCWYSMEGGSGLVCPECGKVVAAEPGLLRTRRRWWRATGSLLVVAIGAAVGLTPWLVSGPMLKRVPRPVLVVLVCLSDRDAGPAFQELATRAGNPAFQNWAAWEIRWSALHAATTIERNGSAGVMTSPGSAPSAATGWFTSGTSGFQPGGTATAAGQFLVELGPRAAPAIPVLLRTYAAGGRMEGELLAIFPSIAKGDDRVLRAVAGRLAATGDDESGQLSTLEALAASPEQGQFAAESIAAVFGKLKFQHEALDILTRLAPGSDATTRVLAHAAMGVDFGLARYAVTIMATTEPPAIDALIRVVQGPEVGRAAMALEASALANVQSCELAAAGIDAYRRMTNPDGRWWCMVMVSRCPGWSENHDIELRLFDASANDPSRDVRATALATLAMPQQLSQAAIDAAVARLNDEDPIVRKTAVDLLIRAASLGPSTLSRVLAAMGDHPDQDVIRSVVRRALEGSADDSAIKPPGSP